MQLCQINPLVPRSHVRIFSVCVFSWPGPTSLLRNTEGKGHRVLLFGFIKWQPRARFWTGPLYPVAIKFRVTAAVPWHCLRNFLFSVSTSPRPCCCLMSFFPLEFQGSGGAPDGLGWHKAWVFVTLSAGHQCWQGFTSLNQGFQGVSELSKGKVSGVCVSCTWQERVTWTLSSLLSS